MRLALALATLFAIASPASAEIWLSREGGCGDWQARWDVTQEQTGTWIGDVEYIHIGGLCSRPRGEVVRGEIRAVITGDNLFAVRSNGRSLCTYVGRIRGDRAQGFYLCEGSDRRWFFGVRFRSQQGQRPLREIRPDEELLDEPRRGGGRQFRDRGLDDWFERSR